MPKQEVIQVYPTGWENDPDEERFKLSIIDQAPVCGYNHYALFFRLDDAGKDGAAAILKAGLERTLSQVRYMCGRMEPDAEGGLSFVKRKDSSAKLVLQWLDSAEEKYPSLDDIEKAHFAAQALGDLNNWGIPSMFWGERPEANPENNPIVSGYQLNFVRGGLVLSMQSHHWASDVMGWSNFTRHLAANCSAIANKTPFPPWDPARIDVSRFTKTLPAESLVDGPPVLERHPDHRPEQQALLFHLPKSKAARLKRLATPATGWISTYDAMCAFAWRHLSRLRAPLFKPDPASHLWWAEAVDMRPRILEPPLPAGMLRCVVAGAFSEAAGVPQPTAGEVVAPEAATPLSVLAAYIRALTQSCTQAHLEGLMALIAPVRDKRAIALRVDAHPPMSMFVTDHRPAGVSGTDFGFGRVITYRHLWGPALTAGLILIYGPIETSPDPDEGCVFTVTVEAELVPKLLADPEWTEYFEYRGVD